MWLLIGHQCSWTPPWPTDNLSPSINCNRKYLSPFQCIWGVCVSLLFSCLFIQIAWVWRMDHFSHFKLMSLYLLNGSVYTYSKKFLKLVLEASPWGYHIINNMTDLRLLRENLLCSVHSGPWLKINPRESVPFPNRKYSLNQFISGGLSSRS